MVLLSVSSVPKSHQNQIAILPLSNKRLWAFDKKKGVLKMCKDSYVVEFKVLKTQVISPSTLLALKSAS